MAASDKEIRQRVRVDNEASQELNRVAEDTRGLGNATQESGQKASQAAGGQDEYATSAGKVSDEAKKADTAVGGLGTSTRTAADATGDLNANAGKLNTNTTTLNTSSSTLKGTIGGLATNILGMVSGWLSFTAIAGGVVRWIHQINQESREASEAVGALGNRLNDLAINLGSNADQIVQRANALANTEQERDALVDFAAEMTDRRPELINNLPALEKMMEQVLPVQQVTQPGGTELAETFAAFEGAGFRDTYDAMAYFAAAGLGGRSAVDILERVGPEQGGQALSLMLAARQSSNIPERAIRQLPELFMRLNEVDPETGELTEELRAMGITPDMDLFGQVRQAGEAFASGDTVQRQAIRDALLPRHTDAVLPPLTQAITGGQLQDVLQGLQGAEAEDIAAVRLQSEMRMEAELRDRLKFRQKLVEEDPEEARRAFLQDTLKQIRRQRGDIAPSRWLTGAASSFQPEYALRRDLNQIMRDLLEDDPDAFAQIFTDLPEDLQAGIVPRLLDDRTPSEQQLFRSSVMQLPMDVRRRLHHLQENVNDERVMGRDREGGPPVFQNPFALPEEPSPPAADPAPAPSTAPTSDAGAASTINYVTSHHEINIRTNFAGRGDPTYRDIEPTLGLG